MQLGEKPIASFSLDQGDEAQIDYRRFQIVFYSYEENQKRYILYKVLDIKGEVKLLESLRGSQDRRQAIFEGYKDMAFFFTCEAKNKNFKVNIIKKDKSEFETYSIKDESDLS